MAPGAPRFKRDFQVKFVDEGEYRFAELTKADGESVRLYDFEYNLAMELDGRPFDAVAKSAHGKLGIEIDGKQVEEFARSLGELELLDGAPPRAPRAEAGPGQQTWSDGTDGKGQDGEPTAMMQGMSELLAVATRRTDELSDSEIEAVDDGVVRTTASSAADATTPAHIDGGPRAAGARTAVGGTQGDNLHSATAPDGVPVARPTTPPFPAAPAGGPPRAPATPPPLRVEGAAPGGAPPLPTGMEPSASGAPAAAADRSGPPAPAGAPAPAKKSGRGWLVWAVLGLIAAAAASLAAWKYLSGGKTAAVSVRTVVPSPVSVYRWFDAEARVEPGRPVELAFESAGTVMEIRPAGSRFDKGDILALLQGGRRLADEHAHNRQRLAHHEQVQAATNAEAPPTAPAAPAPTGDTMPPGTPEKIADARRLVVESLARLVPFAVIAARDGEVATALVAVGDKVRAGEAALRLSRARHRAVFELDGDDAAFTRRLAFCRVLVDGRPFACEFSPDRLAPANDGGGTVDLFRVAVDIESAPDHASALTDGAVARLARARFDAVFTVPVTAVRAVGDGKRLFVASPSGRAEVRSVSLADRTASEAVIAQGLDVGDAVIVDAPPSLEANAPIVIADRRHE